MGYAVDRVARELVFFYECFAFPLSVITLHRKACPETGHVGSEGD